MAVAGFFRISAGRVFMNNRENAVKISVFYEAFLLFCFLWPAGYGFFAIMLSLSLPGSSVISNTASMLILALTANRVGRMFSAAISAIPTVKPHDAIISGAAQGLGLLCIFAAITLKNISFLYMSGAFFLGIGLTAGNVFFRTLLTSGISNINNTSYSVLFYVFWGLGVAFAGMVWNCSFQPYIMFFMSVVSIASCYIAQQIASDLKPAVGNKEELPECKAAAHYWKILMLSLPAAITACIGILFNSALIPILTDNFGFSVPETGIAACFMVIGNILALFNFVKKPPTAITALRYFSFVVVGNIMLIICLFLLRGSKLFVLPIIIGIGWFSTLSLNFQMDFIKISAEKNMHRTIHAFSEILSVLGGIGFACLNKHNITLSAQFVSITIMLLLWWSIVERKHSKGAQNGQHEL